jgi:hypothetical protein
MNTTISMDDIERAICALLENDEMRPRPLCLTGHELDRLLAMGGSEEGLNSFARSWGFDGIAVSRLPGGK